MSLVIGRQGRRELNPDLGQVVTMHALRRKAGDPRFYAVPSEGAVRSYAARIKCRSLLHYNPLSNTGDSGAYAVEVSFEHGAPQSLRLSLLRYIVRKSRPVP